MQRIKRRKDQVRPQDGTDPTRKNKWAQRSSCGRNRHSDYPHDSFRRSGWNTNRLCIPCRFAARETYVCPHCRFPTVSMPWKFKVPRKQDRWWSSNEALSIWVTHLDSQDREANEYLNSC